MMKKTNKFRYPPREPYTQQIAGQITDTSLALTESGDVMPVYEMEYKV